MISCWGIVSCRDMYREAGVMSTFAPALSEASPGYLGSDEYGSLTSLDDYGMVIRVFGSLHDMGNATVPLPWQRQESVACPGPRSVYPAIHGRYFPAYRPYRYYGRFPPEPEALCSLL